MLILTRRVGTTIYIGDDITVTVLGINSKQVKLGINANRDIPVYREEIYLQIQKDLTGRPRAKDESFEELIPEIV